MEVATGDVGVQRCCPGLQECDQSTVGVGQHYCSPILGKEKNVGFASECG